MENKNALRREVRAEIDALEEDYIAASDGGIYNNMTELTEFIEAQTVLLFYSVGREPDTLKIAEHALSLGKTVAFPFCYRGGIMRALTVRSLKELVPAMLGIPAPAEDSPEIAPEKLDFIVVPALTYDTGGYRLGYGGGYYDRYLSGLNAFKAGVGRERLLRSVLPREEHDIAADCLVTESRVIRF